MNKIADIGIYALTIGGILVMTRPGSQGPGLLTAAANGFAHIAQSVTGQKLTRF